MAGLLPGRSTHSLLVDGTRRHFSLHMPSSGSPKAVLFALHPSISTFSSSSSPPLDPLAVVKSWEKARDATFFAPTRAAKPFVQLYLAARYLPKSASGTVMACWGAGYDHGLCSAPMGSHEDEQFLLRVAEWVRALRVVPPEVPIYLFGYSGGARMVWSLACNATAAAPFAGVAAISGALGEDAKATCSVSTLPRILVANGVADRTSQVGWVDESVAWIAQAASCQLDVTRALAGNRAEIGGVRSLSACANSTTNSTGAASLSAAAPSFSLAYYRLESAGHSMLDDQPMLRSMGGVDWIDVAFRFWESGGGPAPASASELGIEAAANQNMKLSCAAATFSTTQCCYLLPLLVLFLMRKLIVAAG